ncbi:hypothetical protein KAT36_01350 [Candidatus Pacearchaeota archaeon]|nr:hypothetical protein [Candidatus Pacearchaeota archaeon]
MAKTKKSDAEIDIKIKNVDKLVKAEKMRYQHSGHFWIFGSALAMILSYERSASILWTILHGIFSWFYILFRAMQTWGWF